jgi:hypothetical protein
MTKFLMGKLGEKLGKDVSPFGGRWNFLDGNGTTGNVITKMMILE